MAAASSHAHLIHELNRRRSNSPREEAYTTALSFDADRDAIHSTAQIGDYTTQQPLPQHQQQFGYDQYPDHVSEGGSEGSAEMSIELGRGVKRGARERDEDVSSNAVLNLGNDSLYEVTATPPIPPRSSQRKTGDELRRQASIRRATETAKGIDAMKRASSVKHRSLSEALRVIGDEDTSFMAEDAAQTTTFNARNTRFARSRQTSGNGTANANRFASGPAQQAPRKNGNNNPTVQSNSFMLPDLPNITELVSGVHKDGTSVFNRTAKSRSRFISGSYKPNRTEYYPLDGVPIPEEEKAIYASLQLLKDRVDQLEMEKSEAQKRSEEYEDEIIDLRSQLAIAQRRPDSALGSDAEASAPENWKVQKTKFQTSVKSLQERLDRSQRKISVSEIAVKRVTKERDELVTQIGVAYYNNEELKAENEALRESHEKLQVEPNELKEEVDALRKENQDLRLLLAQSQASYEDETQQRSRKEKQLRSKLETTAQSTRSDYEQRPKKTGLNAGSSKSGGMDEDAGRRRSLGGLEEMSSDDLAIRIAREVRKHREQAAKAQNDTFSRERSTLIEQSATVRSRSKSASRQQSAGAQRSASAPKRTVSAPAETDISDNESTTQLDFTQKSRSASKRASLPNPIRPCSAVPREEDSRDITLLSWTDPAEFARLRKKLEEERKTNRLNRATSAAVEEDVTQQTTTGLPRKSSLKDVTAAFDKATGRFSMSGANLGDIARAAKSVRVQSPHTTDESMHAHQQTEIGDTSTLSNTSRRRRRAASAEGMTSAFILPDITLHNTQGFAQIGRTAIQHDTGNCTACLPSNKNINIPTPVPVTDREDPDVTNATVRPAQAPPLALATVIKQLEDEISHFKIQLVAQQRLYNQHDPALSKRRRQDVKSRMEKLTAEIEKRSDQVYALYDVVEGQKQAGNQTKTMDEQEVEETLQSLGIDPVELSGRIGRKAPFGLDGADEMSGEESEELPWEGLSEVGSEL